MEEQVVIGVGMPAWIYLNMFGAIVNDAFGSYPYLVGSATRTKKWRDVDVRLILTDEEYEKVIGKLRSPDIINPRLRAFNLAFSKLGESLTGLPIDFQIQQQTQANAHYPHQERHALIQTSIPETNDE